MGPAAEGVALKIKSDRRSETLKHLESGNAVKCKGTLFSDRDHLSVINERVLEMAKQKRTSNILNSKTSNAKSKGAIAKQLNHTHTHTRKQPSNQVLSTMYQTNIGRQDRHDTLTRAWQQNARNT